MFGLHWLPVFSHRVRVMSPDRNQMTRFGPRYDFNCNLLKIKVNDPDLQCLQTPFIQ